ncbi:MAG: glycosyltransferase family 2 protein [Phycisphaerales bacterium]
MAPNCSIVIATVRRRDSLLETLRALDPAGLEAEWPEGAEVVVVENTPEPELDAAEIEHVGAGRVRLLHEPKRGKWRCLNTAIERGRREGWLGEIIAVLDDDMSPMPGWAAAVVDSGRTRPEHDLFAGKSHVQWPPGVPVPEWAEHYLALNVCFSILTWEGETDREMGGIFPHPSGNHFWFRRSILESIPESNPAFSPGWTTEIRFCMAARARGHRGLLIPRITCGHRVQPALIDEDAFLHRAITVGHTMGRLRLAEERPRGAQALATRGKSAAALAVWTLRERRARRRASRDHAPEIVIERARAKLQLGRHGALLGLRREIGDAP